MKWYLPCVNENVWKRKGENSYIFCCCFPFSEWFFQLFRSEKVRFESSRYSFVIHKLCCVLSDRITGTIYALALEYFGKSIFLTCAFFSLLHACWKAWENNSFYMRQKNFPKQGILCIFPFSLFFFQFFSVFLCCFSFYVCG